MRTCVEDGCDFPATARDRCRRHYGLLLDRERAAREAAEREES